MPYRSEKQRAYIHAQLPEMAKRWDAETGGIVVPKPKKATKSKPAPRAQRKSR